MRVTRHGLFLRLAHMIRNRPATTSPCGIWLGIPQVHPTTRLLARTVETGVGSHLSTGIGSGPAQSREPLRHRRSVEGDKMGRFRSSTIAVFVAVFTLMALVAPAGAAPGNERVGGLGLPAAPGGAPCDDPAHAGADYAIAMQGDLEGCIYGYVTLARFHEGSGTYQERADETFVGTYHGLSGTFDLIENFTAKYDPDTGDQVFGRCKHPVVAGSGTGDLAGVSGRLDFKDDVAAGNAPYKGHLSLNG